MANQSHPAGAPLPLAADVIVDVASLGFAIGEALDGSGAHQLIRPELVELVAALERRGLRARSLQVAVPLVGVRSGDRSDPERARARVADWEEWVRQQAADVEQRFGVVVTPLVGATDGVGDVGIDEVVAWVALEAADAISTGGDPSGEVVVVVSSDSDMWHLPSYAAPTALVVAGGFTPTRRGMLIDQGLPFVSFSGDALIRMSPGASAPPPPVSFVPVGEVGDLSRSPYPLDPDAVVAIEHLDGGHALVATSPRRAAGMLRAADAVGAVQGANTIAVVDAYGMFRATQLAIGAGDLPGPEAVRALLGQFGWDSPIATLFVVPDLSERMAGDDLDDEHLRAGWRRRDEGLDALADHLDGDGDALTEVRRSELRVGDGSVTHKRLATGIVAELWRATRRGGGAEVVVVTEDRDVCWLLVCAPASHRPFPPVTRLGLHPSRVEPLEGFRVDEASVPHQVVLLTEYLAAQLTGVVDRAFGRSLRDRLAGVAGDRVGLRVHGVEPETGRLEVTVVPPEGGEGSGRASAADEAPLAALRAVLHDGEGRIPAELRRVIGDLDGVDAVIELHFDPRRTCSAPQIVVRRPDEDAEVAEVREARVVQREGYRLWVDVDFDGVADLGVPTGHDTTAYRTDDTVVIQQAGSLHPTWALRDPGPVPGAPMVEPVLLRVDEPAAGGAAATDVETDRTGWLEPMPGKQPIAGHHYVFGVEVRSGEGEAPEWIAISTGLQHLEGLVRR